MKEDHKKTIVHLIYCFDVGGLERVLVNTINGMSQAPFRHVIISLTHASSFAKNLTDNIEIIELNKKTGNDLSTHFKLFKHLRRIKPAILHTYNISTVEYHPIAMLAGVKGHIHAEHGRDIGDPQGLNKKHNFLRKMMSYFVDYFVPVSKDLEQWLVNYVAISPEKVKLVYNGMDYQRFENNQNRPHQANELVFGTVARLAPIKDQQNLLHAFALLLASEHCHQVTCNLKIVGDGPSRNKLEELANLLKITQHVEFTGNSNEIPNTLNSLDVFVLSSLAEGIPMTILEAMASGLPIISTSVGGIPELVLQDRHGLLVEKANTEQLAQAMISYVQQPELILLHGNAGKSRVIEQFSEHAMVSAYLSIYQELV
ncbi:TIGR03088 family PEP-CTERM/XrtA system glycosyltransferase [Colwelliaceae bacterium 6471]